MVSGPNPGGGARAIEWRTAPSAKRTSDPLDVVLRRSRPKLSGDALQSLMNLTGTVIATTTDFRDVRHLVDWTAYGINRDLIDRGSVDSTLTIGRLDCETLTGIAEKVAVGVSRTVADQLDEIGLPSVNWEYRYAELSLSPTTSDSAVNVVRTDGIPFQLTPPSWAPANLRKRLKKAIDRTHGQVAHGVEGRFILIENDVFDAYRKARAEGRPKTEQLDAAWQAHAANPEVFDIDDSDNPEAPDFVFGGRDPFNEYFPLLVAEMDAWSDCKTGRIDRKRCAELDRLLDAFGRLVDRFDRSGLELEIGGCGVGFDMGSVTVFTDNGLDLVDFMEMTDPLNEYPEACFDMGGDRLLVACVVIEGMMRFLRHLEGILNHDQ